MLGYGRSFPRAKCAGVNLGHRRAVARGHWLPRYLPWERPFLLVNDSRGIFDSVSYTVHFQVSHHVFFHALLLVWGRPCGYSVEITTKDLSVRYSHSSTRQRTTTQLEITESRTKNEEAKRPKAFRVVRKRRVSCGSVTRIRPSFFRLEAYNRFGCGCWGPVVLCFWVQASECARFRHVSQYQELHRGCRTFGRVPHASGAIDFSHSYFSVYFVTTNNLCSFETWANRVAWLHTQNSQYDPVMCKTRRERHAKKSCVASSTLVTGRGWGLPRPIENRICGGREGPVSPPFPSLQWTRIHLDVSLQPKFYTPLRSLINIYSANIKAFIDVIKSLPFRSINPI